MGPGGAGRSQPVHPVSLQTALNPTETAKLLNQPALGEAHRPFHLNRSAQPCSQQPPRWFSAATASLLPPRPPPCFKNLKLAGPSAPAPSLFAANAVGQVSLNGQLGGKRPMTCSPSAHFVEQARGYKEVHDQTPVRVPWGLKIWSSDPHRLAPAWMAPRRQNSRAGWLAATAVGPGQASTSTCATKRFEGCVWLERPPSQTKYNGGLPAP